MCRPSPSGQDGSPLCVGGGLQAPATGVAWGDCARRQAPLQASRWLRVLDPHLAPRP